MHSASAQRKSAAEWNDIGSYRPFLFTISAAWLVFTAPAGLSLSPKNGTYNVVYYYSWYQLIITLTSLLTLGASVKPDMTLSLSESPLTSSSESNPGLFSGTMPGSSGFVGPAVDAAAPGTGALSAGCRNSHFSRWHRPRKKNWHTRSDIVEFTNFDGLKIYDENFMYFNISFHATINNTMSIS